MEPGSGRHCAFSHLSKETNCDICLITKTSRASCRRGAGTVVPRPEHLGAEQSSICRGDTRLANRVDTNIPVQIKIFPGDPEPNEVFGSVNRTPSYFLVFVRTHDNVSHDIGSRC